MKVNTMAKKEAPEKAQSLSVRTADGLV